MTTHAIRFFVFALVIMTHYVTVAFAFAEDLSARKTLEQSQYLPVDKAFVLFTELSPNGDVVARWHMPDGYYLYKHAFAFSSRKGTTVGELKIPDGARKTDDYFGDVEVYYGNIELSAPVSGWQGNRIQVGIEFQGCADRGLCYPPQQKWVSFDAEILGSAPSSSSTFAFGELLAILASAIFAGLILNLMPCVFPVLSIKVLSLVDSRDHRLRDALGYFIGVVTSFLLLGVLIAALKSFGETVGWGFQLQSPGFVSGIAILFFLLGLNLLGVMEVPGFGVVVNRYSSVATGVLAVVVATPCTVPFMGAAIGYGLSQTIPVLIGVMLALGIGMALPYLMIAGIPQLSRMLPRPGPWMVTLKQIMAFPMFATVVWLIWVIALQAGPSGIVSVLGGIVVVGFFAWYGVSNPKRLRIAWASSAIVLVIVVSAVSRHDAEVRSYVSAGPGFEIEVVEAYRAAGKPVFVNLTASWCITCLANDRTTLSSERVQTYFADEGIQYVKGDWTNADPTITMVLESFGRSGVPLYIYYPKDGQPVVLPQVLTPGTLIQAIKEADASNKVAILTSAKMHTL